MTLQLRCVGPSVAAHPFFISPYDPQTDQTPAHVPFPLLCVTCSHVSLKPHFALLLLCWVSFQLLRGLIGSTWGQSLPRPDAHGYSARGSRAASPGVLILSVAAGPQQPDLTDVHCSSSEKPSRFEIPWKALSSWARDCKEFAFLPGLGADPTLSSATVYRRQKAVSDIPCHAAVLSASALREITSPPGYLVWLKIAKSSLFSTQ